MKLIQSFILIASLLLNSCMTKVIWEEKKYYDEIIKDFLISDDGAKIIFLGKKYHYIFDDNSGLVKNLLQWKGRSKLEMYAIYFEATSPNDIKASLSISNMNQDVLLNQNISVLSQNEESFLKKLGFVEYKLKQGSRFENKLNLIGKRYLPNPDISYKIKSSLNKEYKIRITVGYSDFADKAQRVAMTPIGIVGDTVILTTITGMVIIAGAVGVAATPLYLVACTGSKKKCSH